MLCLPYYSKQGWIPFLHISLPASMDTSDSPEIYTEISAALIKWVPHGVSLSAVWTFLYNFLVPVTKSRTYFVRPLQVGQEGDFGWQMDFSSLNKSHMFVKILFFFFPQFVLAHAPHVPTPTHVPWTESVGLISIWIKISPSLDPATLAAEVST